MERRNLRETKDTNFRSRNPFAFVKISLFLNVIAPYTRQKLDRLYHFYKEKHHQESSSTLTIRQRLIKLYLLTYPYIHMMWEGSTLLFYLAYAIRKTYYRSLFDWIQDVELHTLTNDRLREMESIEDKNNHELKWSPALKDKSWYMANMFIANVATTLTSSFEIGAFFLQFLDWW